MIEPELLADRLQEVAALLRSQGAVAFERTKGELTWQRVDEWETVHPPAFREPLSDDQDEAARAGRSQIDEEDRKGDAAASRYKLELATLTARIAADLTRLSTIVGVCCPPNPRDLTRHDLLVAQVAAEGYCVSCWRVDQALVESAKGRYRDLCRRCGEFKALEGVVPPLAIITRAVDHGWRSITTGDVARALGKAAS